jgi:hypothetical protein
MKLRPWKPMKKTSKDILLMPKVYYVLPRVNRRYGVDLIETKTIKKHNK